MIAKEKADDDFFKVNIYPYFESELKKIMLVEILKYKLNKRLKNKISSYKKN